MKKIIAIVFLLAASYGGYEVYKTYVEDLKQVRWLKLSLMTDLQKDQLRAGFSEAHPDIEIFQIHHESDAGSYLEKLVGVFEGNDELTKADHVDIVDLDVNWVPYFAARGDLLPLDGYFSTDELSKFNERHLKAGMYKGKLYAIPSFLDVGILYYRKDLLKKYNKPVPETWDELVSTAKFITGKEKNLIGYTAQFATYAGLPCNMQEFIASNGAQMYDNATNTSQLNDPRVIDALNFVKSRILPISAPSILEDREGDSLNIFKYGDALFHRNWPYAWAYIQRKFESRVSNKVGIARLPKFEGGRHAAAQGGWFMGITHMSRSKGSSVRFLKYATSYTQQAIALEGFGNIPPRPELLNELVVDEKYPHLRGMYEIYSTTAEGRPKSPHSVKIWNQIYVDVFSKALRAKSTVEIREILSNADDEINSLPDR